MRRVGARKILLVETSVSEGIRGSEYRLLSARNGIECSCPMTNKSREEVGMNESCLSVLNLVSERNKRVWRR